MNYYPIARILPLFVGFNNASLQLKNPCKENSSQGFFFEHPQRVVFVLEMKHVIIVM